MARYYLKPVFWNTENYQRPSGVKANSGYPAAYGFGHEEWNNADFMRFADQGRSFRAFYVEGLGNTPVDDIEGEVFLFMYASHDRLQQLVGIAGKATCLSPETHQQEREDLVERHGIKPKWTEAWDLPIVRRLHQNNRRAFERFWNHDVLWTPNWKCPEDLFFWPDTPITLDSIKITGKQKLLTMFGSYTEIAPNAANRIMASVPIEARTAAWLRIRDEIDVSFEDASPDIADIKATQGMRATTKQALIDARLGQGDFRTRLMERWDAACAVTGCDQPQVLRASHMKPWRSSNNTDRLNPHNGLLLSANVDALCDRGLVSFQDNGTMLISTQVSQTTRNLLDLPASLRKQLHDEEKGFLTFHRDTIFLP
ncbi:HNH endonuclease [uncultured Thiodictyon sp.]|uniref:HNH endonuclease n=1 Tax=uncultured Thiodictyon sp. TaxID=1846217 RepID=UPI0025D35D96|nr:HNH endonuclease [uncultured Thiodictyon sp.]